MASLLDRIANSRGGTFFASALSGVPRSEIETVRANRDIAQTQAREIDPNSAENQEIRRLAREAAQGNTDAARQLFALRPELAMKLREGLGLLEDDRLEAAANRAFILQNTPFAQRDAVIRQQIAEAPEGVNMRDTASLIGMSEEDQNRALAIAQALALTPEQRAGGGRTSELQTFQELVRTAEGPEGTARDAARVELGLDPRASTSAQERIAGDTDLAGRVAQSQGQIAGARTEAEIQAEIRNAEDVAAADARRAALVEAAVQGERITANRIKTADEAKALLPEAEAGAQEMIALLNGIRNDPQLPNVLGAIEGRTDVRLDEREADLIARINQVTGQTFLQAYQSLKGGGPITDREGQAATEAQSRLTNRTVSLSAYQRAIDELIGITNSRLQRLKRKAQVDSDQPRVRTFNPETGRLE